MNAAQLTNKFGVTRSLVHYIASNNFSISPFYKDCFVSYHLRYWSASYLLSKVKEGLIYVDGKEYLVIYHRCTRGQVLAAPTAQVALSFREAAYEFNLAPVVLVSLAPQS